MISCNVTKIMGLVSVMTDSLNEKYDKEVVYIVDKILNSNFDMNIINDILKTDDFSKAYKNIIDTSPNVIDEFTLIINKIKR